MRHRSHKLTTQGDTTTTRLPAWPAVPAHTTHAARGRGEPGHSHENVTNAVLFTCEENFLVMSRKAGCELLDTTVAGSSKCVTGAANGPKSVP